MMFTLLAFICVSASGPDSRALLDAAKAASGGAAWDRIFAVHVTQKIESAGLNGTNEAWSDTRTGAFTSSHTLGPDAGASGWDGHTRWTRDRAGQVRIEAGGEAVVAAVTESYRQRLAYWDPTRGAAALAYLGRQQADGHLFDVVSITPQGGRRFDLWIGATSHRIERMIEISATDTTTSIFSDWRTVNGVSVPFAERDSIGDTQYDKHIITVAIDFPTQVSAAQFAPPPPPPPDFAFAGGVDRVTLPFALDNNHIYLAAQINGKAATVVFDTGSTNYLYSESSARLGVHAAGARPESGGGEQEESAGVAMIDSLSLGALTLRQQLFEVAASGGWPAIEGVPSDGAVGYEIAKRVPVIIDYARREITFVRPDAFRAPAHPPITFRFMEELPEIDGNIDGISAHLLLDTGSRGTVNFTGRFITANNLFEKYPARWEATTGWGVGGASRSSLARAHTLVLGDQTLAAPVIELTAQKKGALANGYFDGNVGGEILRRFTVTLDYAHMQLWLEPNAAHETDFAFDRSGMFLARDGDDIVVKDVTPRGPAATAGVKAGDHLIRVHGKDLREQPLPRLREWLRSAAPGTRVRVEIRGRAAITLTLADLI